MPDNEKKPSDKRQWRLFVFPAILALIGAYFALTKPERPTPQIKAAPLSATPDAR